jgi:hypothetical protein
MRNKNPQEDPQGTPILNFHENKPILLNQEVLFSDIAGYWNSIVLMLAVVGGNIVLLFIVK